MELDRERILELVELLKTSSAAEISVKENGTTIRLARFVSEEVYEDEEEEEVPAAPAGAGPAQAEAATVPGELTTVYARVVGLFYRGKSPGEPPLVNVDDIVKEGQTLGLIEVLRKPTDVRSPVDGQIVEILREEGTGVQYGDPLFVIRNQ